MSIARSTFYADRLDAGIHLAAAMVDFTRAPQTLVLGLPRGGVIVASETARILELPLDVLIVRKLGVPSNPEYAMGAIASGGVLVTNPEMMDLLPRSKNVLERVAALELVELERRETAYRSGKLHAEIEGRVILLIDDGMATGSTVHAALLALRKLRAGRCIVGVPVASPHAVELIGQIADQVICPLIPEDFQGVGQFYDDFEQVADEEVSRCLNAVAADDA